jgi:hypothetical protein
MDQLPNEKDFFYQVNKKGLIEKVDAVTGQLIQVQKSYDQFHLEGKNNNLVEYQLEDGRVVLAEKGIDMTPYKGGATYKYNPVVANVICQKIIDGGLITKICKEAGMPSYALVTRWRHEHPEFNEMYEMAVKARAEARHDEVLDTVSADKIAMMGKDELAAARLRVDTLKWAAEKNDPTRFGKERSSSTGPGALQIVVNTGINRDDVSDEDVDKLIINTNSKEVTVND